MGDTKSAEVPLNVRYDTRLGAVMDWIDIDMVRMTEHLAESEASAAAQKRHSAGRALSVNIHAGIEPPVAGIRPQGRSSILERKRGGMPPGPIFIFILAPLLTIV